TELQVDPRLDLSEREPLHDRIERQRGQDGGDAQRDVVGATESGARPIETAKQQRADENDRRDDRQERYDIEESRADSKIIDGLGQQETRRRVGKPDVPPEEDVVVEQAVRSRAELGE